MDRIDAFQQIAAQARQGDLTFPSNVKATRKLQQALGDPECHLDVATKLVQADPLVSARAVAMANAVAYNRSGNEITSVRAAVQRLGMRTLHSLVTAIIVRQMSTGITHPLLKVKAAQLWEHSAHVAALSQVIARRVSNVDPETAMFAGIVHEIGGFYMLAQINDRPELLEGEPGDWTEHGEIPIGHAVLTELATPAAVLRAVQDMWVGMRALPPETLGDTLLLANDLAPVASPLHTRPGATTPQAARSIDFTCGDGTLQEVMAESAGEVRSLLDVLMQ